MGKLFIEVVYKHSPIVMMLWIMDWAEMMGIPYLPLPCWTGSSITRVVILSVENPTDSSIPIYSVDKVPAGFVGYLTEK